MFNTAENKNITFLENNALNSHFNSGVVGSEQSTLSHLSLFKTSLHWIQHELFHANSHIW